MLFTRSSFLSLISRTNYLELLWDLQLLVEGRLHEVTADNIRDVHETLGMISDGLICMSAATVPPHAENMGDT